MLCFSRSRFVLACAACAFLLTFSRGASAQPLLAPGPWPWTSGVCGGLISYDAFHLLYNPIAGVGCQIPDAALRLSLGGAWNVPVFTQLGVVDTFHLDRIGNARWFSAFAPDSATVLRSSWGDLVLSATTSNAGPTHGNAPPDASIRFGTMPQDSTDTTAEQPHDIERMTILGNGNVGIDIPPGISPHLCTPLDQVQIGGGVVPTPGNSFPGPGLTIYGGNMLENSADPGGGLYPGDWRYFAFNNWVDHTDTGSTRFHRFQPTSSSVIDFADDNGGLLSFSCEPYDSSRGLNNFSEAFTMQMTGKGGLATWFMDTTANPYHHLFDIFLPGQLPWPVNRNPNGFAYFHTPVCIASDNGDSSLVNFQNLPIRPDMGDDTTWSFVVKGPALFKEAFVNELDWPDFVFRPGYKLTPLDSLETFIEQNHHLPDVPTASKIAQSGVPLGRTEALLMQKVEELTKYAIEQNKRIETLESEVQELKQEKGK